MKRIIILAALLTPALLSGQTQTPYERVLIPIVVNTPLPGAFGSLWATQLTARNESNSIVDVTAGLLPPGCAQPPCGYLPMTTFAVQAVYNNPNGGVFIYVGAPGQGKVSFNLRVRDLSRQALTWGTSIPVIRAAQTYTSTLQLLDVPTDSRFRVALRIYDFDLPEGRSVRLRIYDEATDNMSTQSPLVDTVLQLNAPFDPGFGAIPGSAVMTDLVSTFPRLTGAPLLRVVIDPVSAGTRFWAFASVTNNEAQHVTVISPN